MELSTFESTLPVLRCLDVADRRWELLEPRTWLGDVVACGAWTVHTRRYNVDAFDDFYHDVLVRMHTPVLPAITAAVRRGTNVNEYYVRVCVQNACRDVATSHCRVKPVIPFSVIGERFGADIPDRDDDCAQTDREVLQTRLHAQLRRLDSADQELLRLFMMTGSRAAVAQLLGVTYETVRGRLERIFGRLRWLLGTQAV